MIQFLFLSPTQEAFRYDVLTVFFNLGRNRISVYALSEQFQDYLSIFFKEKIRLEHVTGLSQFARNISFLSLISIISLVHELCWQTEGTTCIYRFFFLALILTIAAAVIYALLEIFRCLKILSTIYLMCIVKNITNNNPNSPEDLIKKIHAAYFVDNSGTASKFIQSMRIYL